MLQIRKKLQNVFKHFDTDLGDFLLSKGYFKIDKGIFQIIEDGGARRMLYSLSEITVYDDTASGFPETFLTDVALYNRLFELGYNLIDYNGVNPSTPTVYASESPIDAPFTGSNTFELPLNYILISVFLDVDLRIKAEYIRTPTGIIILDTLVDGNIISIRGFIASGSVVGSSVMSVNDDDNGVVSVDNSSPTNPVVKFNGVFVDGTTITGKGTEENPLVSVGGGGGVIINDTTPSLTQTYSSEKSEDTFVKRSGTEAGKPVTGDVEIGDGISLITEKSGGTKSLLKSKVGKWQIEIEDGINSSLTLFDPDKGIFSDKLFDIDNDEKAYIQKGHIVQLEEDIFNLQIANTGDETTASIQTKRPLKTVNGNSLEGSGNIVIGGGGGGAVDSVNGQTGVVVLNADDIDETATRVYITPSEKTAITHSNRSILDNITEAFTTGLKTAYDSAVTWISTNGTNLLNHLSRTDNPHSVTKTQVGLGNVDNTSDVNKPISTATQTALDNKQDTLNEDNFGTFTNSVENKETQANTDILGYIDVTTGKWVKQTFSKLIDYLKGFFVDKTTAQTIDGVKTFTASPIVPTATTNNQAVNKGQLDLKADQSTTYTKTEIDDLRLKPQIEVSGNNTVDASWNGKEVSFLTSGLLTISGTLPEQFAFNLYADNCAITWAISAPFTWRVAGLAVGTAPRAMVAGEFCRVERRIGTNEIRILGL